MHYTLHGGWKLLLLIGFTVLWCLVLLKDIRFRNNCQLSSVMRAGGQAMTSGHKSRDFRMTSFRLHCDHHNWVVCEMRHNIAQAIMLWRSLLLAQ